MQLSVIFLIFNKLVHVLLKKLQFSIFVIKQINKLAKEKPEILEREVLIFEKEGKRYIGKYLKSIECVEYEDEKYNSEFWINIIISNNKK